VFIGNITDTAYISMAGTGAVSANLTNNVNLIQQGEYPLSPSLVLHLHTHPSAFASALCGCLMRPITSTCSVALSCVAAFCAAAFALQCQGERMRPGRRRGWGVLSLPQLQSRC